MAMYICYKVLQESKDGKRLVTVPSENVAEVVRCKDCKYFAKWRSEDSAKRFGKVYECRRNILIVPKVDDYCSKGERKDED